MPPIRFWFEAIAGFIMGAIGAWGTVSVQLSGSSEPIATATWLTLLSAGLGGAVVAGRLAWPATPVPRRRRRRLPHPPHEEP